MVAYGCLYGCLLWNLKSWRTGFSESYLPLETKLSLTRFCCDSIVHMSFWELCHEYYLSNAHFSIYSNVGPLGKKDASRQTDQLWRYDRTVMCIFESQASKYYNGLIYFDIHYKCLMKILINSEGHLQNCLIKVCEPGAKLQTGVSYIFFTNNDC